MSLPWFRAYTRMVDDDKLRLLAFEDRWHYVALLCCKGQGLLDEHGPLMRRKVAVKLGLDLPALDEVVRRLSEVGLISAKNLQPVSWDKLQFTSDHDPTKSERQRRFREKNVTDMSRVTRPLRNGHVTRTDTDTDTDTDKTEDLAPTVHSHLAAPKRPAIPVSEIVDLYHELLPMCPKVRKLTTARKKQIEARWRCGDLPDLKTWRDYFEFCAESKFLTGLTQPMNGHKHFVADLEWLSREGNYTKIYERKYHR